MGRTSLSSIFTRHNTNWFSWSLEYFINGQIFRNKEVENGLWNFFSVKTPYFFENVESNIFSSSSAALIENESRLVGWV